MPHSKSGSRRLVEPSSSVIIFTITFHFQDSLWQAEDIDAVFDQDPQRVCILQGPVAVAQAKVKDEPIKDIFGNITSSLVKKLLDRYYDGDESKVPLSDYIAPSPKVPSHLIECAKEKDDLVFNVSEPVPETSVWLENLAGPRLSWLRAILTSPLIVRGTSYVDNPLRRLLTPRAGQKVIIHVDGTSPTGLEIFGATRSFGTQNPTFKAVEIKYTATSGAIDVTIFEERRNASVPLKLQYKYVPSMGSVPVHEVAEGRNTRIKDFYWRLWFGDNEVMPSIDVRDTFTGPEVTIQASDVETFCSVVGNEGESFKTARKDKVQAPMDFGIVTGWQVGTALPVKLLFLTVL